jgi:signal peptidase II
MRFGESHTVLPFFNIVLVKNEGVTFGLLSGSVAPIILIFASITVIIFAIMLVKDNRYCMLPMALVIGGAVGNIIDRIRFGGVIDFLDFHICGYHWPAFNIADSAIVIGVCILFIMSYLYGEKK